MKEGYEMLANSFALYVILFGQMSYLFIFVVNVLESCSRTVVMD